MQMIRIAVDGPAGSGKSTVAKIIATRLKMTYLDTGAMYRAVTYHFLSEGIDWNNDASLSDGLASIVLDMSPNSVTLNGNDVTEAIRTTEITSRVSEVAALAKVRRHLVHLQQEIAKKKSIIMDGRDIGTVVLPEAEYKFFLTASVLERAERRTKEMLEKGYFVDLDEIMAEIERRDTIDSTREESPLVQAKDAILIDTTGKGIDRVVQEILNHMGNDASTPNEKNTNE